MNNKFVALIFDISAPVFYVSMGYERKKGDTGIKSVFLSTLYCQTSKNVLFKISLYSYSAVFGFYALYKTQKLQQLILCWTDALKVKYKSMTIH